MLEAREVLGAWDVGMMVRPFGYSLLGWTLLTFVAPSLALAQTTVVSCGGFPLSYGTTIGASGPTAQQQSPRSVEAVAAVTKPPDLHALAWVVWDERGQSWLALVKGTPADLQRLWRFPKPPDFGSAGSIVQISPLTAALPQQYELTYCSAALSNAQ